MADTKMNVGFMRGPQSNLDKLTSYKAGSFYLTTDSNRLYFAQSENKLEYLNKYITTVANVTELYATNPHEGDFYYVSEGNILCFCNNAANSSSASGWTQVNTQTVDTNTDTKVTGATLSNAVDADSIDVSISIAQTTTNHAGGGSTQNVAAVTGTTSIKKSDLDAWYNKADVGVTASAPSSNAVTVSTSGTGASSQKFTVTGGANVTIGGSKDAITIASKDTINTSALSSSGNTTTAKITLTESDNQGGNSTKDVNFAGNTDVIVNGSTADTIKITHKTGYLSNTTANVTGTSLQQGDTIKVIGAIKTSNGHVSAIETTDYILPEVSDATVDANGKINITVKKSDGTTEKVTGTSAVGYKVDGTLVPLNQDLADHFYTEEEIDDKFAEHLKSVNAMTYKGSLTSKALPTTAAIGDVYVIGTNAAGLTVGSEVAKVGDLIIAYGTEGADGNISGTVTWELIPGTEIDTTYTISAASNKITLTPSNGSAQNITLADDDVVTLTSTGNTITAKHHKPTITNTAADSATTLAEGSTITLVESETVNAYGHTETVVNKKYTLPTNFNTLGVNTATKATQLKNSSGSVIGDFVIDGGTRVDVSVAAGDGANDGGVYTIKHAEGAPTVTNNTTASQLSYANEFTVVTEVTASDDKTGHLKTIKTQKFQLPAEVTYSLSGSATAANNIATISSELKNNAGTSKGVASAQIASSTLNITAASNKVTMDLQWGEF